MKIANLTTLLGISFVVSIGVFGLSISGYLHPPPQLHPVVGTLTATLKVVTLPGKGGGIRHQLEMSSPLGAHTAIIRNFESHKPGIQAAVKQLTVGSAVTMSFATADFFTSPCHVWEIETPQAEVLSMYESLNVERVKNFRAAVFSGVLAVVFALWGWLIFLRYGRDK